MAEVLVDDSETIILTFGVSGHSIDAYTLADAIIAFANFSRSVDRRLNPGQDISIEVETLTPGSVRAKIRRVPKGAGGFFSDGLRQTFWAVVSGVLVFWIVGGDPDVIINVGHEEVVIRTGGQTVIVSRESYEKAKEVAVDPEVDANGRDFFKVVERNEHVTHIGVEPSGGGNVVIRRPDFGRISRGQVGLSEVSRRRKRRETAKLAVIKPSLHKSPRKWAFEWNGVPMSAKISDDAFLQTMRRRGFLFGYGDALEVELSFEQEFDEKPACF